MKKKHGHTNPRTPTYNSWRKMMERCYNPNQYNYPQYGALGVRTCKSWKIFANFLSDMGVRPKNRTLDRINPSGNYKPSNCRWATNKQQANNRRGK